MKRAQPVLAVPLVGFWKCFSLASLELSLGYLPAKLLPMCKLCSAGNVARVST
jgi:hypothetical protein